MATSTSPNLPIFFNPLAESYLFQDNYLIVAIGCFALWWSCMDIMRRYPNLAWKVKYSMVILCSLIGEAYAYDFEASNYQKIIFNSGIILLLLGLIQVLKQENCKEFILEFGYYILILVLMFLPIVIYSIKGFSDAFIDSEVSNRFMLFIYLFFLNACDAEKQRLKKWSSSSGLALFSNIEDSHSTKGLGEEIRDSVMEPLEEGEKAHRWVLVISGMMLLLFYFISVVLESLV